MSLSLFLILKGSYSGLFSIPIKSQYVKDSTIYSTEWHKGNFAKKKIKLYSLIPEKKL